MINCPFGSPKIGKKTVGWEKSVIIFVEMLYTLKKSLHLQSVFTLKSVIMKKLVLLIGIVILSMNVFAQERGDKYFVTSASASFGSLYQKISNGHQSIIFEQPMETDLGLQLGFGWFVAKNFRLELCLNANYEQVPREQSGDKWLNNTWTAVGLAPSLSYYVRLADRFYYTPEIGVNFAFGKYTFEQDSQPSEDYNYKGYELYANLLAFRYRVTPKFSLGVIVSDARYNRSKYYNFSEIYSINKAFRFNLNYVAVDATFYL